jgi:hypothetical protein
MDQAAKNRAAAKTQLQWAANKLRLRLNLHFSFKKRFAAVFENLTLFHEYFGAY